MPSPRSVQHKIFPALKPFALLRWKQPLKEILNTTQTGFWGKPSDHLLM